MGTTTSAAPAPSPETKRPVARAPMLGARASPTGPKVQKMVVSRMVIRRPYRAATGPAQRAPKRPPRVKIEDTRPSCVVFIGIHCGSPASIPLSLIDFRVHVITSCGAFSSALAPSRDLLNRHEILGGSFGNLFI